MFDAVIVMAGKGERFGLPMNKALYPLMGKPLFIYSVDKFLSIKECNNIILVCNENDYDYISDLVVGIDKIKVCLGGERRQDSVLNGLRLVKEKFALIHDAARPYIINQDILKVYCTLISGAKSATLGHLSKDSVRYIDGDSKVLDRSKLVNISTPQGFETSLLLEALEKYPNETFLDDTEAVEKAFGIHPEIVYSSNINTKITEQSDIPFEVKIGQGFDIHRIEDGGCLLLGGINVSNELHFVAHSDGDCLLHAIMNALFGAIGSSDIGEHFPDSDLKYKNIDSEILCEKCLEEISEKGYIINNIDCSIVLETPKLSSFKDEIRENISRIFNIPVSSVSVKANTFEKIGTLGEGKACECLVIASVMKGL